MWRAFILAGLLFAQVPPVSAVETQPGAPDAIDVAVMIRRCLNDEASLFIGPNADTPILTLNEYEFIVWPGTPLQGPDNTRLLLNLPGDLYAEPLVTLEAIPHTDDDMQTLRPLMTRVADCGRQVVPLNP